MSIKRLENENAKLAKRCAEKDAIIQDLTNKLADAQKLVQITGAKQPKKIAPLSPIGSKEEDVE